MIQQFHKTLHPESDHDKKIYQYIIQIGQLSLSTHLYNPKYTYESEISIAILNQNFSRFHSPVIISDMDQSYKPEQMMTHLPALHPFQ